MALATLVDLALLVTLWATGIAVGALSSRDHVDPRGAVRWIVPAAALNMLVVPVGAALVCRLLAISPDASIGVILVASAGGGVLGLTTSRLAGGDVPRAIVLVLILQCANLLTVPLWSSVLLSTETAPPLAAVARTLTVLILLPLAVGLLVCRFRPDRAAGVARACGPISFVALVLVVVGVLVDSAPTAGALLGTAVPVAAAAVIAGAMVACALLGGPLGSGRRTLALVSAGRFGALALALSRSVFEGRAEVEAAVVVTALIGVALPIGAALALRSWERGRGTAVVGRQAA